jgi:hypothetical protein
VNPVPRNPWLVAGGWLSIAAALLHLACIPGGPDWYRFFGAGEPIARAAERGMWTPHLIAGRDRSPAGGGGGLRLLGRRDDPSPAAPAHRARRDQHRLSARGLVVLAPSAMSRPDLSAQFMLWSSLIVLVYGVVHAVGTWRMWPLLSRRSLDHHAVIS